MHCNVLNDLTLLQVTEQPLNTAELESKFAVKVAEKKKDEGSMKLTSEKEGKDKLVSVFDPKKSNAISFMLAKLPPVGPLKEGKFILMGILALRLTLLQQFLNWTILN